jgi:hypothetical protein
LQFAHLTKENVVALYRFALLLKGTPRAAGSVLLETLGGCAGQIAQFRNNRGCLAFSLKKLRESCLKNGSDAEETPPVSEEGALLFARRFSELPEPQRSSLALLYLDVFTAQETAALLGLTLEEFSVALGGARALLRERQILPCRSEEPAE